MGRRDKISLFILLLMALVLILAGIKSIWEINYKLSDVGNQISWVLVFVVLSRHTTGYLKKISISLGLLSFGEGIDESRGVNAEFHINDYILLFLVTIWTIHLIYKAWKTGRQRQ